MTCFYTPRLPNKRCPDIIGAGGLGGAPSFYKVPPPNWGVEGLDEDYFSILTL